MKYVYGEICNYQNLEANPNGSLEDIAGITDETGRILGLMHHPERAIFFNQLPNWNLLKEEFHSIFSSTNSLQEFSKLKLKHDLFEPPNKTNSNVFDFDSIIKLSDIPDIVSTKEYNKITYFKELNTKRFNRKNLSKKTNSKKAVIIPSKSSNS